MTTPREEKGPDRAALMAKALEGVAPANARESLTQRLAPWRALLIKYRREGYSLAQLSDCLAKPDIGIVASTSVLKRFLAGSAKKRVAASNATATPAAAG